MTHTEAESPIEVPFDLADWANGPRIASLEDADEATQAQLMAAFEEARLEAEQHLPTELIRFDAVADLIAAAVANAVGIVLERIAVGEIRAGDWARPSDAPPSAHVKPATGQAQKVAARAKKPFGKAAPKPLGKPGPKGPLRAARVGMYAVQRAHDGWRVINRSNGKVVSTHDTREAARTAAKRAAAPASRRAATKRLARPSARKGTDRTKRTVS